MKTTGRRCYEPKRDDTQTHIVEIMLELHKKEPQRNLKKRESILMAPEGKGELNEKLFS